MIRQLNRLQLPALILAAISPTCVHADLPRGAENFWHQWRGPEATGVSHTAAPPLEWSEQKNVKWKVPIEGSGSSSPIVWGDKLFLLTAINTGTVDPGLPKPEDQPKRVFDITNPNTIYRFVVICLNRKTGEDIWRRTATERVPHEGHHQDNNYASASPTTDGKRLYCWFGSAGLFCYDVNGTPLWERDLGKASVGAILGEGCSPVLHNNRLAIVRDHSGQSTIHVLDSRTGTTLWEKNRAEPNAWSTPLAVNYQDSPQLITAASNRIRSYDLNDGELIWQCKGLTGNVIPCPVTENDVVYCMSGYEGFSLLAIKLPATGDISDTDTIQWKVNQGTPYIPSPLLYDGMLYYNQSNQAIITCLASSTGKTILKRTRLSGPSTIYASPVGANNRIYFTGRNGTTVVIERSDTFNVLATNRLDDQFVSSPALAGDQLFLRGNRYLYCLQE